MQRVIRRTKLAQAQSRRKARILEAKILRRDRRVHVIRSAERRREELDAITEARKRRREDWELGSLTPWREVAGAEEATSDTQHGLATRHRENASWGTFSPAVLSPVALPASERLKQHQLLIRPGDRVCVVEGRQGTKGRIGRVQEIDLPTMTVKVKGVNKVRLSTRVTMSLRSKNHCSGRHQSPERTTTTWRGRNPDYRAVDTLLLIAARPPDENKQPRTAARRYT